MAWQYHLAGWRAVFDADSQESVWRPDVPDVGRYGAIDLRPSKARGGPSGLCLVATPTDISGFKASAVKFGVSPDDPVPAAVVRMLGNRLGLSFAGGSVKELLYELLKTQANDADPNKWDSIKPTAGRKADRWKRYEEIYLGELIDRRFHSEVAPGANTIIINDQFTHVAANEVLENEAPDTTNTPGNNWDNIQNTLEGDGSNNIRWDTANNNAQMANIGAGDASVKVLTEFKANHATNKESAYVVARNFDMATNENQASTKCIRFGMGNTSNLTIVRKDNPGGATVLATNSGLTYNANTWYVLGGRCSGSTLAAFWETPFTLSPADQLTATESTYSTQTFCGFGGWKGTQNHLWNKFIVDDDPAASGGAVTFPTELIRRRQNTLLRM